MTERTVNVPLLRKAVEWAEAEAAKPWELSEWNQWDVRRPAEEVAPSPAEINRGLDAQMTKAPECGTCFCIAGYVTEIVDGEAFSGGGRMSRAADLLGLGDDWELFDGGNTIEDVRRIAESIAGERL